jgi:hypothetical protein
VWTDLNWIMLGGCCEHGNESSGSLKLGTSSSASELKTGLAPPSKRRD